MVTILKKLKVLLRVLESRGEANSILNKFEKALLSPNQVWNSVNDRVRFQE